MGRSREKNNFFISPDEVKTVSVDGGENGRLSSYWWEKPKENAYQNIIAVVNSIEHMQKASITQLRVFELMYGDNRNGLTQGTSYVNRYQGAAVMNSPRLTVNVCQSCVDTLASKISSNKPKPQFVPNEGDWKLYSKAKLATEYLEGIFDACKIYPLGQRMFTESCISGIAGIYVHSRFGKITAEYVMRDDIYVDELDGHTELPSQLHLKRFISRSKLKALYPKMKDLIDSVPPVGSGEQGSYLLDNTVSDTITFVESWHLPTSPESKDGKYAVVIENCTLELSDYQHDTYPIAFFRPYHKPHSFWGRGLIETLFTLQTSLNRLLRTIQMSQDQVAKPNWLVENGSQVNTDHISDQIGQIIEYSGTPPQCIAPEPMPESAYQWAQYLEQHAYQISGISQASAAGEKPKDVESAVAMETVADIEAGRFENMSISYNEFYMEVARIVMMVSQDLYLKKPKLLSKVKKNNLLRQISWKDLDFDADKFSIQLFPINRLPHDPSGRLDVIERYIQAGWIDEVHGMDLLDMPDISENTSMMTSSLNLVRQMIATMLDDGEPQIPLEQMDLALARTECKLSIVSATYKKYPADRIQLVIDFDQKCKDLLDTLAQEAQLQAMQNAP